MKRMDIDALRKAHEKLKRKSQRQKERIGELENLPQGLLQLEATLGHVQELEEKEKEFFEWVEKVRQELDKVKWANMPLDYEMTKDLFNTGYSPKDSLSEIIRD